MIIRFSDNEIANDLDRVRLKIEEEIEFILSKKIMN